MEVDADMVEEKLEEEEAEEEEEEEDEEEDEENNSEKSNSPHLAGENTQKISTPFMMFHIFPHCGYNDHLNCAYWMNRRAFFT